MKFAVIETGGKQYLVKTGDKVEIEKITGESGSKVVFEKVLLAGEGESAEIGKPYLAGVKVEGKIIQQDRASKVLVMKYHSKTRYRRKRGHRQSFTRVEITKI